MSRPEKREEVIKLFINPSSKLCLIIATTAFGMGIDCPNIRRIIHWGLPSTCEDYAQEKGRDGSDAEVVLYGGEKGRHAMQTYVCH